MRPHFLAFIDGRAIMGPDTAGFEPARPPGGDRERDELAEMSRPLDRAPLEAQFWAVSSSWIDV